jgi:hypothetical protein
MFCRRSLEVVFLAACPGTVLLGPAAANGENGHRYPFSLIHHVHRVYHPTIFCIHHHEVCFYPRPRWDRRGGQVC